MTQPRQIHSTPAPAAPPATRRSQLQAAITRPSSVILASLMLAALMLPSVALADSPLTSTDFAVTYAHEDVVVHASEVGYDDRVATALSDPEVAQDVRAAIINALGWNLGGQNHAEQYLLHVAASHELHPRDLTIDKLTPQETFALGYLLAMDDYLDLGPMPQAEGVFATLTPDRILDEAQTKSPNSFAVAVVAGLVDSQMAMDSNWCQVYRKTTEVTQTWNKPRDLSEDAVAQISEYIDLYASECTNPKPVAGP